MKFALLSCVCLKKESLYLLPTVPAGVVGIVVDASEPANRPNSYEVEFCNIADVRVALLTCQEEECLRKND